MDDFSNSEFQEPAGQAPGPVKANVPPKREQAGNPNGWCTTLQQPATLGLVGYIVYRFLHRRRT